LKKKKKRERHWACPIFPPRKGEKKDSPPSKERSPSLRILKKRKKENRGVLHRITEGVFPRWGGEKIKRHLGGLENSGKKKKSEEPNTNLCEKKEGNPPPPPSNPWGLKLSQGGEKEFPMKLLKGGNKNGRAPNHKQQGRKR